MPLISYGMSVGINKNSKNKQQKQHSLHDMSNMRHACNTCSMSSAGKLTDSAQDTVPRQDEHKWWQQQQQIRYYFGGFPIIRGCLLFVLWPWPKQEKLSLFFRLSSQWQWCPSDGQRPRLGARCKAHSDTWWCHHQKSVYDFDNWQFTLVWTANEYKIKYKWPTCSTNWISHKCFSSLSCVTPVSGGTPRYSEGLPGF